MAQLPEGAGFDLADALASEIELLADLGQGVGFRLVEPEAQRQHATLALGQARELQPQGLALEGGGRLLVRGGGVDVDDGVGQLGVGVRREPGRQRQQVRAVALDQLHPLDGEAGVGGDLDRRGRAVERGGQPLGAGVDERVVLAHVRRDADRAGAVGDGAPDRLADPPRGVGRELEAAAMVELLDGAHEAEVALLDEIEQRQPAGLVAAGH